MVVHDDRLRARIQPQFGLQLVGGQRQQRRTGEALGRQVGAARVDHHDAVAQRHRLSTQRLRVVSGSVDQQGRGGHAQIDEEFLPVRCRQRGGARVAGVQAVAGCLQRERLHFRIGQRSRHRIAAQQQPPAVLPFRHQRDAQAPPPRRPAARRASRASPGRHPRARSARPRCRRSPGPAPRSRPPTDRSAPPRAVPDAITSSADSTTSASRQPPDSMHTCEASSRISMRVPSRRYALPRTRTTLATAARCPRSSAASRAAISVLVSAEFILFGV